MKLHVILSLFFLFFGKLLLAQPFVELVPPLAPPFADFREGTIAHADMDGDGDQDILLSGRQGAFGLDVKLYTNDGTGFFTEIFNRYFDDFLGDIAFADVDGDGDQDVFATGQLVNGDAMSALKINDGEGGFARTILFPFEPLIASTVSFADVDNDGDEDILLTGVGGGVFMSKLYTNDGTGSYTEVANTPFVGVSDGMVSFVDVDNDNDLDVLIGGKTASNTAIVSLYTNDGTGGFTEVANTPFDALILGDIAFADIDGDMDVDVLVTGFSEPNNKVSKLYINDGTGAFTVAENTPFVGVMKSDIAFSDVDNDGDQDVLIIGEESPGVRISKLYTNDGKGQFTAVGNHPFINMAEGNVLFVDVDNDGDEDVIMAGKVDVYESTRMYINDGTGQFVENKKLFFENVGAAAVAYADVDGDQDQDVIVLGGGIGGTVTSLHIYEGEGIFSEKETPFVAVKEGDVAFSDIDGDNDPDVLIMGVNELREKVANLYVNDGTGQFTAVATIPFEPLAWSLIHFVDVNNDGFEDVFISGTDSNLYFTYRLYINDGTGQFMQVPDVPFSDIRGYGIDDADVDGDGDLDILIAGQSARDGSVTKLYINDGMGGYSESRDNSFVKLTNGDIAFSDVDGDGDEDALIVGLRGSFAVDKMYINDGTGQFTETRTNIFMEIQEGDIAFADMDGDGDEDIFITGLQTNFKPYSKVYENDGTGEFEAISNPFFSFSNGDVAFFDIDGDGDQDALMAGNAENGIATKFYRNNRVIVSLLPTTAVLEFDFALYPNPTYTDQLTIRYQSQENKVLHLRIYDLQGKCLVKQQVPLQFGEGLFSINIAALQKGCYFVELNDGVQKGVQQLMVE